ncbi:MAG: FAD-dependent oxidoreductase [Bacilli bacterium]|nr:FAD-dependent oxidoreductase [Bacilli bacterium]
MQIEETVRYCLACLNPRCVASCPCGNAINAIMSSLKQGKEEEAAKTLYTTNPFPELTSLLCDHDRQCKGHCVRGIKGKPVDFPSIEAYLGQKYPFPYRKKEANGLHVAIVGAGPSALSAAVFLSSEGADVTIYEKEESLGGAMLTGIPSFRLGKAVLAQIKERLDALGVNFRFGVTINKEILKTLRKDYDEVLLAVGASKENDLGLVPSKYILHALPFLRSFNLQNGFDPLPGAHHIVVMGGGNVAMDASRSLIRLGKKVTLIYRRDEASMPAQRKEIFEAKEDGVAFMPLTNLAEPLFEGEKLVGLKLVKMELGEKDESGRPSFHVIEGSEFDFPCDAFMMAIGEKSGVSALCEAEDEHLHFIGDCRYGARNIAAAIKDGREAAKTLLAKNAK